MEPWLAGERFVRAKRSSFTLASAQAGASYRVSAAEARPGDLVWWPGHVGIYTGNGNNIAARQPGTPLTEGPIYHSSPTFIRVS